MGAKLGHINLKTYDPEYDARGGRGINIPEEHKKPRKKKKLTGKVRGQRQVNKVMRELKNMRK